MSFKCAVQLASNRETQAWIKMRVQHDAKLRTVFFAIINEIFHRIAQLFRIKPVKSTSIFLREYSIASCALRPRNPEVSPL